MVTAHREQRAWSLGTAALVGVAFLITLPSSLTDFDGGEFAVLAVHGGIAHPPGYPLWTWMLRAAAALAGPLNVVQATSLLAAACVVLAAYLMHRVAQRVVHQPFAALVGVLAVCLASPVWRVATSPEPFAFNLLLVAVVLRCSQMLWEDGSARHAALMGLAFGAGAAHHHTLVLMLPLAMLALAKGHPPGRAVVLFLACGVVGALPVLSQVAAQPEDAWVHGDWSAPWTSMLNHFLRRSYGTFSLAKAAAGQWWQGPWALMANLPAWLSGVFFLAAGGGLVLALQGGMFVGACLATLLLSGVVFPMLFHAGGTSLENMLVARFLAMPIFLLAIPVAFSAAWLLRRLAVRGTVLLVLCLGGHAVAQWGPSNRAGETFLEDHARNVLMNVEQPALVITNSDHDAWGLLFGKRVLGLGARVEVLPSGWAQEGWYMRPLVARVGVPQWEDSKAMLDAARAAGWNILTLNDSVPIIQPLLEHAYPEGPWVKVARSDAEIPDAVELYNRNIQLLDGKFHLPSPTRVESLTPVERNVLFKYARPWRTLQQPLAAAGAVDASANCERMVEWLAGVPK